MKAILWSAVVSFLLISYGGGQDTAEKTPSHNSSQAAVREIPASSQPSSGDIEQMRADLERLKVLLNQMRTNLAFVQTSQSPLKHQFELETDAWQLIVEQMERRLKRMEGHGTREPAR